MTIGHRLHTIALAAIMVIGALGCATTNVKTDKDPRADLQSYHTFEVKPGKVVQNGVVDQRDTLVRDRVEAALEQELQEKGLQATEQNPDLIATYTAGARTITEVEDGWGRSDYYAGYNGQWIDEYNEGTLIIDLIDTKTNKLVWRAVVKSDGEDLRSAKHIDKAVSEALEKYPGT